MNIGDKVKTVGTPTSHTGSVVAVDLKDGNGQIPATPHVAIKTDDGIPWLILPCSALQLIV